MDKLVMPELVRELLAKLYADIALAEQDMRLDMERLKALGASDGKLRERYSRFNAETKPLRLHIEAINKQMANLMAMAPPAPFVVSAETWKPATSPA